MNAWVVLLRRHSVVRVAAAALFLYGFAGAATSPYQSVIGIRELGLSDRAYAFVAMIAAAANVVLAIGIGLMSDRLQSYRKPLIVVTGFGVLGYGIIWALPSPVTFALATIGPLALFHATNSMLFGAVRSRTAALDPAETHKVNALMRIMISLSWVLVPGVVGIMLRGQDTMIPAYLIAAVIACVCLATIVFGMDDDVAVPATPRRPALTDLNLLMARGVLARVLGVALISQVLHINATVLPLIVTGQANGQPEDIGFLVGLVAALEVVFMIFWAWAVRGHNLTTALLIASSLYFGYLAAIAFATEPWHAYVASLVAGFAAAALISLPISYLLDLIQDRPGLSASLIAVNMFAGGALGAAIFAVGTTIGGYGTAAVLSGLGGILGAGLLATLERNRA